MTEYTRNNPVTETGASADGTVTAEVAALGRKTEFLSRNDRRLPAFAGLAKTTGGFYAENQGGMTLPEAMRFAQMNYEVEFQSPIEVTEITAEGVTKTTYPGRGTRAVWEGNPQPVGLGIVGDRYQLVQPREAGELGEQLMQASGATVVAAGIYGRPRGSQTYLAFKLPETLTIGGKNGDEHDLYLTILNSFNGTSGLIGLFAPIRLACTNMTTATFGKGVQNRFTIRHSGDIEKKKLAAMEALGVAQEWTAIWKEQAEVLLKKSMTDKALDRFLVELLGINEQDTTSRAAQAKLNQRLTMKQIITQSDTCEFGRGTAYAALQGAQEWADWFSGTKASGELGDITRYTRTLNGGATEKLKLRAASLLSV